MFSELLDFSWQFVANRLTSVCLRAGLLLLAIASRVPAQHTISTFAGGIIRSGVAANSVLLDNLAGYTWDKQGNLLVCDEKVIRRVRPDGIIETISPPNIAGDAGPSLPRADSGGNIYFFDASNGLIRRLTQAGTVETIAGDSDPFEAGLDLEGPAQQRSLAGITDMTLDPAGNLYLAESNLNVIREVTPDAKIRIFAQDVGVTRLGWASGALYAASHGYRVDRVGPDGSVAPYAGYGGTLSPAADGTTKSLDLDIGIIDAMAAFADGTLLISRDNLAPKGGLFGLLLLTPDGQAHSAQGPYVDNLAVGPLGQVVITAPASSSGGGAAIKALDLSTGSTTFLAGANPVPAPDGTPARDAWLLGPSLPAIDAQGDLFFFEELGCRIRKIGSDGLIQTVAGTGDCTEGAPSQTQNGIELPTLESLAVDSQGSSIYLTDRFGQVYRLVSGSIASLPLYAWNSRRSMAIDAQQQLVALSSASVVTRLNQDGTVKTLYSADGASFESISSDLSGQVFLHGRLRGDPDSIYQLHSDGTLARLFSRSFVGDPFAVDAAGNVWTSGSYVTPSGAAPIGPLGTQPVVAPNGDILETASDNSILKITGTTPSLVPRIAPGGIVNSLSYTGGGVTDGELVSIFGSNFGGSTLVSTLNNNRLPSTLGGVQVQFGGLTVPLLSVSPTQINAIVAWTDGPTVDVQVVYDTAISPAVTVPVAETAVALASIDASGSGQGAIVNQDGTINSVFNPAPRGSIVSLYGTGEGEGTIETIPGFLTISTPYSRPNGAVTVAIGGQMAEVLYAGAAPFQPVGVFQINARIPTAAATGNASVTVTIGPSMTSRNITVAVR